MAMQAAAFAAPPHEAITKLAELLDAIAEIQRMQHADWTELIKKHSAIEVITIQAENKRDTARLNWLLAYIEEREYWDRKNIDAAMARD